MGAAQTFIVLQTGRCVVRAAGAQEGANGGLGARVTGTFDLAVGTSIKIIVGGQGASGHGYASINLVPAPAVPEPSGWAMLTTGFGGIGAMLRRRRLRDDVARPSRRRCVRCCATKNPTDIT